MSPSPTTLSLWESASRACADAFAPTVQWFGLLTDTQRLLLPTSVVVVVLLWNKMCPPKAKPPHTSAEDEAMYTAAIERWSVASEASEKKRAESPS